MEQTDVIDNNNISAVSYDADSSSELAKKR